MEVANPSEPECTPATSSSRTTSEVPEVAEAAEASAAALVPTVEQLTRVIALDGPAGSGKSSVARRVAGLLGWRFVDTGATYRAVTLAALRAGVPLEDTLAVTAAACAARVELSTSPAEAFVRLDGGDVTAEIRGPEVTAAVSAVSAIPAVRTLLISLQRQAMGTQGAVVEGRDIATVVAPRAAVKVYLDAEAAVRARRRAGEQPQHQASTQDEGRAVHAAVQAALATRDALDNETNRLEASEGALHLDTTQLSLDQVVAAVIELAVAAKVVSADQLNVPMPPPAVPGATTALAGPLS